jgi:hypothetical protein
MTLFEEQVINCSLLMRDLVSKPGRVRVLYVCRKYAFWNIAYFRKLSNDGPSARRLRVSCNHHQICYDNSKKINRIAKFLMAPLDIAGMTLIHGLAHDGFDDADIFGDGTGL